MAPTVKDVAREAGVSTSTVSRAFTRPDVVDAATRERVLEAARRLSYRPNRAAQVLNTGRTDCLGVVLPDLENPFFAGVLKGIRAAGLKYGKQILVADSAEDPAAELRAIDALAGRVDGLILCSSRLDDDQILTVAQSQDIVLVNRACADLPAVVYDNSGAIASAVVHLTSLGHQRIAYVDSHHRSRSARDRLEAFTRECDDNKVPSAHVLSAFEPTFDGGRAAVSEVLACRATGVVVYNDVMAIGLVNGLLDLGIAVPERVSVVGIDGIPLSAMTRPAMTTVDLPRRRAGERAVEQLVMAGQASSVTTCEILPTQLVIRGSTAAARPTDDAD